jgi:hypothetical protein
MRSGKPKLYHRLFSDIEEPAALSPTATANWTATCTVPCATGLTSAKCDPVEENRVTDGKMKALLVSVIVLLAAATAFAYGRAELSAEMSTVVAQTSDVFANEPTVMLLSGGVLLVVAGAMRRFPFSV